MSEFVDTQILIDVQRGETGLVIDRRLVSSVAANEFLFVHSDNPVQARYYVPLLPKGVASALHTGLAARLHPRRKRPFNKFRTDSVHMDFGGLYPSVVEYGNLAISEVINSGASGIYDDAISFLPKEEKKTLQRRLRFLLDLGIQCVPLSQSTVEQAHTYLAAFVTQHSLKAKFRNSWNDMLIAATAAEV